MAYTPTFTGFGTATSIQFYSRRVGDTLEVKGLYVVGTTTGVANKITLGFNGVNGGIFIDPAKAFLNTLVGAATAAANSATLFGWTVLGGNNGASTDYVQLGVQSSTTNGANGGVLGNALGLANGSSSVELFFSVPIAGWGA